MRVADILKVKGTEVVTCQPEDDALSVARLLASRRIGAAVVVERGQPVGMLSERDLVRALAHSGVEMATMVVRELMTRNVITCTIDDAVCDLMSTMTNSRVRHLPVLHDGQLVGLVSIGDVVKLRVEEIEDEAHMLRDYVEAR